MEMEQIVEIGRDLLYTALLLSLPTLAASLLVGLIISVLQAITSIQEQTLSFVPRLLAVGLVLVVAMPWTMQLAVHFTMRMFERAAGGGR
jgi:flagellar biosynthetic protein FliQ